jgi:hypothetical protein
MRNKAKRHANPNLCACLIVSMFFNDKNMSAASSQTRQMNLFLQKAQVKM